MIRRLSLLGDSAEMRDSIYNRKVFAAKAESRNAITAKKMLKVKIAMVFTKTGILFREDKTNR